MKIKALSGVMLLFVLLLWSCSQWIDTNINVDPNSPLDASLDVILPSTQASIAYIFGGDIARYTNLFTQQITGINRQHLGLYNYQITESDINNAWVGMYVTPMLDLKILMDKATANGSPYYQGIAEIEMALSIGMWTDILGDIPYSQAFKGNDNLRPAYDTQEDIYKSIFNLLDSAITHLNAGSSTFEPGTDDLIYGGNLASWIKAANTMKARYHLHLKQYTEALAAISAGISDNSEDLQFVFGLTQAAANPLYQFIDQRAGDIVIGTNLINMMNVLNDPRMPAYAVLDDSNHYSDRSEIGLLYASVNSPVVFYSYAETKFIEAELQFRLGNSPSAYTAYLAGIEASLAKAGVAAADITTYLANPLVGVGAGSLTLKIIMEQKYIAMFTNPESWTDWRRTAFPALTPIKGNQIPRRIPYPQNERLFNFDNFRTAVPNYADQNFIFTKVWWDQLP